MTNHTDILRKIKALLTTANDSAATPGEVEAALGRVSHLAAKYGVTDTQIDAVVDEDGRASVTINSDDIVRRQAWRATKITRWDWGLLGAAALATDCSTYRRSGGGSQELFVYGLPTDAEVCLALFEFARGALRKQVRAFCKSERAEGNSWVQSNSIEGRSFKDGFCDGLKVAATNAKQELSEENLGVDTLLASGCTALIPLSTLVEAKRSARSEFAVGKLKLRPGRRSSVTRDPSAFASGHARGKSTSMNRNAI